MGAQDSANTHGQNWGGDAGHSATGAGGDGGTAALGLAAYSAARIPRALATLVVVRSLLTAMAITLPIPCGVFMPVLVVGCAVGAGVGSAAVGWAVGAGVDSAAVGAGVRSGVGTAQSV